MERESVWPFRTYEVISLGEFERTLRRRGVREGFVKIEDANERDQQFNKYISVRDRFYALHLRSLSTEERRQFADGTHPSQCHSRSELALPICRRLEAFMSDLGLPADVSPGFYHLNRIVLTTDLMADPQDRRGDIPWLFYGYEVKPHWETNRDEPEEMPVGVEPT